MNTLSVLVVACAMIVCLFSVEGQHDTMYESYRGRVPSNPPAPVVDPDEVPPPLFPTPRTCNGRQPPEGRWEALHYLQQSLTNSTLTLQARTNFTLGVEFGNENFTAYAGNATGEFCCDGQVPDGVPLSLFAVAIFDPADCSFVGTLYNFEGLNFSVAIKWWYDGLRTMEGIFVDTIDWTTVVPGYAAHRLTYAEDL